MHVHAQTLNLILAFEVVLMAFKIFLKPFTTYTVFSVYCLYCNARVSHWINFKKVFHWAGMSNW